MHLYLDGIVAEELQDFLLAIAIHLCLTDPVHIYKQLCIFKKCNCHLAPLMYDSYNVGQQATRHGFEIQLLTLPITLSAAFRPTSARLMAKLSVP